jgi:type I restriction enzyme M protein
MFYTTNISVTVWILNRNKKKQTKVVGDETRHLRDREREVLFMDLRQMGEPFEKKFTQFNTDHIAQITGTYHAWQASGKSVTPASPSGKDEAPASSYTNIPEFCYSATFDEIAKKDFSLVPSKYIEFVNRDENIDFDDKMKALQTDFAELLKAEEQSKKELLNVFKELGYAIEL